MPNPVDPTQSPGRFGRFARTPPALFPAILGLLGLGMALRAASVAVGLHYAPAEMILGAMTALWLLAALAITAKVARRPASVTEDLRALPGRVGYPAATMSGMMIAAVLVPYAPRLAFGLGILFLILHGVISGMILRRLWRLPKVTLVPSAPLHLAFVGFIVGAVPMAQLGWTGLATGIFYVTLPVAALILGSGLGQTLRGGLAVQLRPLLAIHLAPLALLSLVAGLIGAPFLAMIFAGLGLCLLTVLILTSGWLTRGGFSPLWSAFTFPLAALSSALLALPEPWSVLGLAMTALALMIVPYIGWQVLRLWPGGKLAAKTNAATA